MMRKRHVKQPDSASAASEVQRKKGAPSRWGLKRGLLALFVIFILVPFSLRILPELIQHLVYTHRIRVPFFIDFSQPADFSLNHTINMYLTSEEGISLGVWHTVPESQWQEAQGKDLAWYQNSLSSGSPVFIYLHGNTGSRAATHRVGVAKVLSALGYHVLVPDYRGFGDSTGEPTEAGLTTDALYVYNWVKARSRNSLVVIWGHSLGTGVATNTAVKLIEQGAVFDGVILEGAFNSAGQKLSIHPFVWVNSSNLAPLTFGLFISPGCCCTVLNLLVYISVKYYWRFPGSGYFFPEPWAENNVVFPTVENLKKMRSPILFLHSEDDHIVPFHVAQQMYEVAASAQNKEQVKLVLFEGSLGYLHNGLYRDPRLPDIIKTFVLSL